MVARYQDRPNRWAVIYDPPGDEEEVLLGQTGDVQLPGLDAPFEEVPDGYGFTDQVFTDVITMAALTWTMRSWNRKILGLFNRRVGSGGDVAWPTIIFRSKTAAFDTSGKQIAGTVRGRISNITPGPVTEGSPLTFVVTMQVDAYTLNERLLTINPATGAGTLGAALSNPTYDFDKDAHKAVVDGYDHMAATVAALTNTSTSG